MTSQRWYEQKESQSAHLLSNDKSKASSAVLPGCAGVGLSERLEESRQNIFVDSDSGVLDLEEQCDLRLGFMLLPDSKSDGA